MRARVWAPLLTATILASPGAASTQELRTAISRDTVLVGDVFHAAIRVDLPAGYDVAVPDSLPLPEDLDSAGRLRITHDTLPDGGVRVTAIYPVSAWRTGRASIPSVSVPVAGPDGPRELEASFPTPIVRSVLPSDSGVVDPRPPKDVLGGARILWPFVVALLGALLLFGAVLYWRRRRRRSTLGVVSPVPPRERALAAIDHARSAGFVEAGDFKQFYSFIADALRAFLDESDPDWGADLTTSELLARTGRVLDAGSAARLGRILESADLVKFARRRPSTADAIAEWETARRWVETVTWGVAEPEGTGAPETASRVAVAAQGEAV